jgi:LPXTG-motif cell wall-anchored protein
VNEVIQTAPVATVEDFSSSATGTSGVLETGRSARGNARELPETASSLPLIMLLGLGSIGVAFGLIVFGKRDTASAV